MTFGRIPERLDAHVQPDAPFLATMETQSYEPFPAESLEMRFSDGTVWPAVISGMHATWDIPAAQVNARPLQDRFKLLGDDEIVWAVGRLTSEEVAFGTQSVLVVPSTGAQILVSPSPRGPRGPKGDKGNTGAAGGTDTATAQWINTGTQTRAALDTYTAPLLDGDKLATALTPAMRFLGGLTDCVIVGSSNATPGTWGGVFCDMWGLTERNFAIGGTAFTGTNPFLTQLQNAAASSSFANDAVGVVIVADASNNIRGGTPSVATEAGSVFSYARATFPNARVIMLPVVWPADPVAQVYGVPGGYQPTWHAHLHYLVDQIRSAAIANGVEVVEDSWTWLTGLAGVMESSGGVHPNAAGYTEVSRWLSRHIRGEVTRRTTPWTTVPYTASAAKPGSAPALRMKRDGWLVRLSGGIQVTASSSGGYVDLATAPVGYRPTYFTEVTARQNGAAGGLAVTVYENGVIRLWANPAVGAVFGVEGTFEIG